MWVEFALTEAGTSHCRHCMQVPGILTQITRSQV